MTDKPDFLYRGTTRSRIEDDMEGNSTMPPNWTDDPLQGASYALGHVLGNSEENIPVVLATEYEEEYFVSSAGVPNYFPEIPVDGGEPDWYSHQDDRRFNSENGRDEALEMFDVDSIGSFAQVHLGNATLEQAEAVKDSFDQFTSFKRYHEVKE